MRFKTFYLNEDIIQGGRLVTFYHRTGRNKIKNVVDLKKHLDDIDNSSFLGKIKKEGPKAGGGNMYGKGIYGTYELESQLNNRMIKTYGPIIIKMKTIIDKVLIFDYTTAKKIYGKKYTIIDQLDKFGIKIKPESLSWVQQFSKELETTKIQSDYVLDIMDSRLSIYKKLKGIMYYGNSDGYTIVIFDEKVIVPMSINTTFEKYDKLDNTKWIDIKNKDLISRVVDTYTGQTDIDFEKQFRSFSNALKTKDIELIKDIHRTRPDFLEQFKSGKNLEIELEEKSPTSEIVIKSGTLVCDNLPSMILVKGNAKVKCNTTNKNVKSLDDFYITISFSDKSELICDYAMATILYDNAIIKCKTFEEGVLYNNATAKCKTFENSQLKDKAQVVCDTWKEGSASNNSKVECNTWIDGKVYKNAQVYIKGKLAKIENNMVVQ